MFSVPTCPPSVWYKERVFLFRRTEKLRRTPSVQRDNLGRCHDIAPLPPPTEGKTTAPQPAPAADCCGAVYYDGALAAGWFSLTGHPRFRVASTAKIDRYTPTGKQFSVRSI